MTLIEKLRVTPYIVRGMIKSALAPKLKISFPCLVGPKVILTAQGNINIGHHFFVDRYTEIVAYSTGSIEIGNHVFIGHHSTIASSSKITIGNDVLIADMVTIRDHDHRFDQVGIPIRKQGSISKPVHIGNNVWIGSKVTITAGVTIGDNCVIGANAVVTKDIPSNSLAVGIPARVIRQIAHL